VISSTTKFLIFYKASSEKNRCELFRKPYENEPYSQGHTQVQPNGQSWQSTALDLSDLFSKIWKNSAKVGVVATVIECFSKRLNEKSQTHLISTIFKTW